MSAQGNHDVSPEGLFRSYYGPEDFVFVYGDSLFGFADNNSTDGDGEGQYPEIARHVRQAIDRHRDRTRHVFVVLHQPVNDYVWKGQPVRNAERCASLFKVLEEERVDAVLTGHYHAHIREHRGETLLLVSGGGGYVLQPKVGSNHTVVIDVTPEGIRDTLVPLEGGANHILDRVRCEAALYYPVLFGSWWRPLPAVLVGAGLISFGLGFRGARRGGAPA